MHDHGNTGAPRLRLLTSDNTQEPTPGDDVIAGLQVAVARRLVGRPTGAALVAELVGRILTMTPAELVDAHGAIVTAGGVSWE